MANPAKVFSPVTSITDFGAGVYEVTFAVPPRFTRFLPGQFLHLTLDEFDPTSGYWPESRVFSIASEPKLDHVSIVYSVKGNYTRRMQAELAVGRKVWLKLPYGDFVIGAEANDPPVVLIAGGTGVSPYRPFLLADTATKPTVHLFYGVRQPEHLLFREDFRSLVDKPWFSLHLSIETGQDRDFPCHHGRLSIERVFETLGPSKAVAAYYLSGPPAMIRAFRNDLIAGEVSVNRIFIDEWE